MVTDVVLLAAGGLGIAAVLIPLPVGAAWTPAGCRSCPSSAGSSAGGLAVAYVFLHA